MKTILTFIALAVLIVYAQTDAQSTCEQTHSRDVCFQELNR